MSIIDQKTDTYRVDFLCAYKGGICNHELTEEGGMECLFFPWPDMHILSPIIMVNLLHGDV